MTRRSGDLSKEGDERLVTNWHAILKPQNLIDLLNAGWNGVSDAIQNPLELLNLQIDAGWISVSNVTWNPSELSDLWSGTGWIDVSDTGWLDMPDVVNSLSLMGNDVRDTRQQDTGQLDTRRITTLLTEAYQVDQFLGQILCLLRDGTR